MEIKESYKPWILTILYAVGIVGISLPSSREFLLSLTPFHLITTTLLVIPLFRIRKNPIIFIIVGLIGYIAEVIGVNTGLIFGDYEYLDNLGPFLLKVPILLTFLWAITMFSSYSIAKYFSSNLFVIALITATLATGLDFLIEPICEPLGYWKWDNDEAGWNNYITWFVLSFLLGAFLEVNKIEASKLARINYFLTFGFFIILNFTL